MSALLPRERRQALVAAAAILAWFAATAWARPLMLPDEGRYAGVAWEMLRSGDWLTPTLNGLPFFHKPPLFYWITAGAMSLLGIQEWAARTASVLGAWLGTLSMYLFVLRWKGPRQARLAALALALQPMFFIGGQFANLDMLVAGCITATILLLAHAALRIEAGLPARGPLAGAYAMAALGVLAKGLIGVVLPGMAVTLWLLSMRRWRTLLALFSAPGALLFLVIAGPWFLAMQSRFPDFLHYFFVVQHFERFAASGFNNVQPWWFYPAVLAAFSLPWLYWIARTARQARDPVGEPADPVLRLMWIWPACVVGFFSLPQSKLIGYVLPAVPPLAYLASAAYATLAVPSRRARRAWQFSAGAAGLLCLVPVLFFALHTTRSTRELARTLQQHRASGEPVVMLGRFAYDVPLYAGLREPVAIVDDWSDPGIRLRDNWRKELADAGAFDARRAAGLLVTPHEADALACAPSPTWLLGDMDAAKRYPGLAGVPRIASAGGLALYRTPGSGPTLSGAACPRRSGGDGAPHAP